MRTPLVHAFLQTRSIVIPDMKVGYVPFNQQGFRLLDSLDTIVQIEGKSSYLRVSIFPPHSFFRSNPATNRGSNN